ncbi:hypothetical protein ASPZODRAFT_639346 [Penicilliopsis zonata CBS 506.65]|uniref:NTF2 domain-containing protein n=1 Tax=Penicilliopsis zonata CBS 506.65 TaxID=1073090 RepID=A0A1L9SCD1_9EURO|nr:hypothetical protein ASPZODRAFT_639346 [Penicilliopsis zonata CBS 506.65]OJJ44870.1 hypothetical protein ASPZODRAFT_639346 [Penicilliopsis zonata CBS 506.65]
MADTTQTAMNGTYPAQQAFPEPFNPAHGGSVANFQPAQSSTPTNATPEQKGDISKDEVGWFFVEQFYTTMSRSPEKLHLFYSRRSQLVFGTEAEPVLVSVGQKAINERIKQLEFQDCKVRVLNVDSQASFDNILVSVIGEISNKSEPSRKFVQTFVLAEQPNGYYVLNDIFRYLVDEEEDLAPEETAAPEAEAPASEAPEAAVETVEKAVPEAAATQADTEVAAVQVDKKLEEAETNGEVVEEQQPQEAVSETADAAPASEETEATPAPVEEAEELKEETTATPEPTPAEPAQKEAPAPEKEAAPPARAVPKTWATIASKIGGAAPAVPAIPVSVPKATPVASSSQPVTVTPAAAVAAVAAATTSTTTAAAAPAPAPAAAPAAAAAETGSSQDATNDNSGWQTAGADNKKTQARAGEEQNVLAYIKNVTEKVDATLLRQVLSRFGKLKYFDVSRQKVREKNTPFLVLFQTVSKDD